MPNVISRGTPKLKIARHKCNGCNSVVEYTGKDIRSDQRQETYVVCPVCDSWIDTVRLDWRFTNLDPHDPDQEPIWKP